jgi:cytochrome P450
MGMEEAMFSTIPNDLHRSRRTPLNPFFSKKAILECEDVVHDKVERLCRRIKQAANTDEPLDLSRGFRALSVDVVTDYSFNNPLNLLEQDDFGSWFADMLREASPMFWIFQQFPILAALLQSLPPRFARKLSSSVDSFERLLAASKSRTLQT